MEKETIYQILLFIDKIVQFDDVYNIDIWF